jgi:recombination protein RecR
MPALDYPGPIQRLIMQFKSLPGVGPRSAERIALWLLRSEKRVSGQLAETLRDLEEKVEACADCGFYSERGEACLLCTDAKRERHIVCVIEQASDVLRLERSRAFHGLYHVLGGKLSPLDNVTPEDLRIDSLMRRVRELPATEVILALGSDVEGEATANYLSDLLRSEVATISKLAQGMPAGGGLDHVDELTIHRALHGRRSI